MPKSKKKVHDLYSPKIAAKRKRRAQVNAEMARKIAGGAEGPVPPTVDNFQNNKPLFGPHRICRLEAPVIQRKISPTEGQATVNTRSGTLVKRLTHKVGDSKREMDPAAGAIEATKSDKSKKTRKKKPRAK